ncbi:cytochrome ubiquinol oxidase subunit I, partial [Pantoea wallisii]|uniref:cytochrome ubiquinol oxidase subunit I n=1 Tax=Pantoea wallisii TaxID=1076551 RepID=UPI00111BF683
RLFAWPDQQQQRNHFELAIPAIGSLYLRHNLHGHIKSLSEFAPDTLPPVLPVFFAFRLMVGLGLLMLLVSIIANVQRWRGKLLISKRLLTLLTCLSPVGFIALLAGWVVTEVGRQPWTLYGLLRTAESVSPISLGSTVTMFGAIVLIYSLSFALGLYCLLRVIAAPLPDDCNIVAERMQTPA